MSGDVNVPGPGVVGEEESKRLLALRPPDPPGYDPYFSGLPAQAVNTFGPGVGQSETDKPDAPK
jgi:hypothetical protein